tara:strand:+ start:665 stop:916 length:252 start_codon:yes stop_codon:yes gene_type:complete
MKYTIELSEEAYLENSDGNKVTEMGMLVQIWNDLKRISETGILHQEDALIKKILEQILDKEFNGLENVPVPDFYTYHERNKEE